MNHVPARLNSSGALYQLPRMKCVPAKTGASARPTRKRSAYSWLVVVARLCAKVKIPQKISRVGRSQRALSLSV